MIDKSKLSIKDRYKVNNLIKEYTNNRNCNFIDIFINEYNQFFNISEKKNIVSTFDNYDDKHDILKWEISKIIIHTKNLDTIVINDDYFNIKIEVLNTNDFFEDFIKTRLIDNHLGMDIMYYNETKLFSDVFFDEEKEVIWFHKRW